MGAKGITEDQAHELAGPYCVSQILQEFGAGVHTATWILLGHELLSIAYFEF